MAFYGTGQANMTSWGELTGEIAVRFDLGLKARSLVQEVLRLIAAEPRGIDGFLDKFKAAGLEEKAASWLREPYPMALSTQEVKEALSAEDIKGIAEKAGITESFATKVLGYAIPKIASLLAANCVISEDAPALLNVPNSARPSALPRVTNFSFWGEKQMPQREMEGGRDALGLRLAVPGAALLITLGLFGYVNSSGTAGDHVLIQFMPGAVKNTLAAPPRGAPGSEAAANEAHSAVATDQIKSALGDNIINGNFAVWAGWIKNLSAAADGVGSHDSRTLFAGNEFKLVGPTPHADGTWMMGSLGAAQVPQFVVAALTSSGASYLRVAPPAPVDFPLVIFAANSAAAGPGRLPLLRRIAERIKQLPPGSAVEIIGYTHGSGASAASTELSQQRAESVYKILIREGVSPAMLSTKGYGSSSSVASSSAMTEGRSSKFRAERDRQRSDRRVEFHVVQPHP